MGVLVLRQARLHCLSPGDAAAVVAEATRPGDEVHTVSQDGPVVIIGYYDKRWPLDVASWAQENGHASDEAAGSLIGRL